MTNVFKKQVNDLKEIVPDFYIANATVHFDEQSPHLHIIGVPVKENCKTGLERQVGKTSIFTKESLVLIQDKMRERCIYEFNQEYELNNKLKVKQKGKNKDYTAYERLKFNEKANDLKRELSNLREEVLYMKVDKITINEELTKLNKDKEELTEKIDEKKDINEKLILKSKTLLLKEKDKLKKENEDLKHEKYHYETSYNDLKEKTDYLISHINKEKLPEFIKKIVDELFNYNSIDLKIFKQKYEKKYTEKEEKSIDRPKKKHNLFNTREIEQSTRHINKEMDRSAEEFYTYKKPKQKEKDNGFER